MSLMTVSRCRRARNRSRRMLNHFICTSLSENPCVLMCLFVAEFLCGLSDFGDGEHQSIPARFFCLQLFSSGACELVELRFAAGFVYVPARRDPTFLLDAIEGGIQRSMFDIQHFVGELAEALDDPVTVQLAQRERLENQHVECSLQQIGLIFRHVDLLIPRIGRHHTYRYLDCQSMATLCLCGCGYRTFL